MALSVVFFLTSWPAVDGPAFTASGQLLSPWSITNSIPFVELEHGRIVLPCFVTQM